MTRYRSLKGRQRISDIILMNECKWENMSKHESIWKAPINVHSIS